MVESFTKENIIILSAISSCLLAANVFAKRLFCWDSRVGVSFFFNGFRFANLDAHMSVSAYGETWPSEHSQLNATNDRVRFCGVMGSRELKYPKASSVMHGCAACKLARISIWHIMCGLWAEASCVRFAKRCAKQSHYILFSLVPSIFVSIQFV